MVQTGFADGHHPGMRGQFAQMRSEVVRRFEGVVRMPADYGVDVRMFLAESDGQFAAGEVGPDANHSRNPGGAGSGQDLRKVRSKIAVIQMRVGVVKDRHK